VPKELKREPDFEQFLKVLRREGRPTHLPFYEHLASPGFIARRVGAAYERLSWDDPDSWRMYVDFWLGMAYDCVPMEIPFNCPMPDLESGAVSRGSEALAVFRSMEDFERYPWPDEAAPLEFRHFETVASMLPDGAKIVGGVCAGPFERASQMMGIMGLSYALVDNPELVERVFDKLGALYVSSVRQLACMDGVGALRQGDDLGFKTATFLRPDDLRRYVFPIYSRMVEEAHRQGKPFILHSCGNLDEVYEDLIEDCGIDAKHSFEDVILPVTEFKKRYGDRVTPLGGLDVDVICRAPEGELRAYARRNIEQCFSDGYWAMGTGNSLTDYMPVDNYLVVLEEAMEVAG